MQGAKAELNENPPELFNPDRILDIVTVALGIAALTFTVLGISRPSKGTTVINNYYYSNK